MPYFSLVDAIMALEFSDGGGAGGGVSFDFHSTGFGYDGGFGSVLGFDMTFSADFGFGQGFDGVGYADTSGDTWREVDRLGQVFMSQDQATRLDTAIANCDDLGAFGLGLEVGWQTTEAFTRDNFGVEFGLPFNTMYYGFAFANHAVQNADPNVCDARTDELFP